MRAFRLAFLLAGIVPTAALADIVAYSNLDLGQFVGDGVAPFFVGADSSSALNRTTSVLADDIEPLAGLGGLDITQVTVILGNFNATPVTFRTRFRVWEADQTTGDPTNFVGTTDLTFDPITLDGFEATFFTATFNPGELVMPDGFFWFGFSFDNNGGTTGASDLELLNVGLGLIDAPTIGASADVMFETQVADSFFGINNPAVDFFGFSGDVPLANIALEITVIPEPSTYAMVCLVGIAAVALGRKRKAAPVLAA